MHGLRSDGLPRRVPPENPLGLRLLLRTLDESRGIEFILSLCPWGGQWLSFQDGDLRAHVCAHVGFFHSRPHSAPPPVTDRFDTRRRVMLSATTKAISEVNWAAMEQQDDKGLLGSCQRVALERQRPASSQQIPTDRLVCNANFEMKIAHLWVRRSRV